MNPKDIGEVSEAQVIASLLKEGENVLLPFGDNKRYDLVIENNGIFKRVQIKTGRLEDGKIKFPTCSSYSHRGKERKTYMGEIDCFMIYCPELDTIYEVPISLLKPTQISFTLRLEKTKNGQNIGVHLAEDYIYSRG